MELGCHGWKCLQNENFFSSEWFLGLRVTFLRLFSKDRMDFLANCVRSLERPVVSNLSILVFLHADPSVAGSDVDLFVGRCEEFARRLLQRRVGRNDVPFRNEVLEVAVGGRRNAEQIIGRDGWSVVLSFLSFNRLLSVRQVSVFFKEMVDAYLSQLLTPQVCHSIIPVKVKDVRTIALPLLFQLKRASWAYSKAKKVTFIDVFMLGGLTCVRCWLGSIFRECESPKLSSSFV